MAPPRLTPRLLDLVNPDRLDRPVIGVLTAAQAKALALVAKRPAAFAQRVSPLRAIQALARGTKAATSIPILVEVINDRTASTSVRVVAARELGRVATSEAEKALLGQLRAADPRVQQAVFESLGALGGVATSKGLSKLTPPAEAAARRQWTLARTLVAHRLGADAPFLAAPKVKSRRQKGIAKKTAVTVRMKTSRATETARERLAGTRFGIELAARAAALSCGLKQWNIFFNSEFIPAMALERPWIVALLARTDTEGATMSVRHLVLTRPEKGSVRIDVVRADGELMYTGHAKGTDDRYTFSIADVDRPGTSPVTLTGRFSAKGLEVTDAVASEKRVAVRTAVSVQ
jgi:hypothetical protein